MKYTYLLLLLVFLSGSLPLTAQSFYKDIGGSGISVSGKIQSDVLFPQEDKEIETGNYTHPVLSNSYLDVNLESTHFKTGARFEMFEKPLPGFESAYEGTGIPFWYAAGNWKNWDLTIGSFYEQFGSGMLFRTYEERSLGVDNSLRGTRLKYHGKGIAVKALGGQQRYYWNHTDGTVIGGDAELHLEDWIKGLSRRAAFLQVGFSYVSKYQKTEGILVSPIEKLNLPEHVGAFASRATYQKGGVNLMLEYAIKANDPSSDNGYIYKKGHAALFSGSYSKKGMGFLFQAKRSDNMSFRSVRAENGRMVYINHLPAFTKQHTYALPALYPYATQPDGEWAFQSELSYQFKKGTIFGGRYGTNIQMNMSRIHSIEKKYPNGQTIPIAGTDGYTSHFFKVGDELYYEDFTVELSKILHKRFKVHLMYMNQIYNQQVIEGHSTNGNKIYSNVFLADGTYSIRKDWVVRTELQYLQTKQDQGDWMFGLIELSFLKKWMLTVSDMYNSGDTNRHYYMGMLTFSHQSQRIQASFGRTRAGFNCSGGVCRYVPASKGFQISYFASF